jgi:TRAP-type mannitol/chloroaromatic compound transport system permease small subunit
MTVFWRGAMGLVAWIDALNERVGRAVTWLVLAVALVSAGNALARYAWDSGSNAWLELQWYLFAAIFLLAAGYTLRHNGHVRIDVLYGRWSARGRAWIDLFGSLVFLLPMAGMIAWMSWDSLAQAYTLHEGSPDAGGLLRWPVRALIPLGFGLLALQGVAEAIRRAAFLAGYAVLPMESVEERV